MNILILGHGQHGKDQAAEYLEQLYGISWITSSWAACEHVVYPVLAPLYGYTSPQECYDDRRNHREEWYDLIEQYNTPSAAALTELILFDEGFDCYVGMRSPKEYKASRRLFDAILWIDAHARKPEDPTMKIQFDPQAMIKIDNNKCLGHLHKQLAGLGW